MIRKLQTNNGETLIEAMISLLIAVFALGLVASATIAAANINKSTKEADKKFAEELQAAEIYSAPTESKKLQIKFEDGSFLVIDGDNYVNVNVYGESDSTFASYIK